jgi:hypothetical protein
MDNENSRYDYFLGIISLFAAILMFGFMVSQVIMPVV